MESARFVIPQIPGDVPRSTPIYGVLESLLKSKKYFLPLAVFHPLLTGGMAIAYLGSGRFDPAKGALVLDSSNELRPPIASDKRLTFEDQLKTLLDNLHVAGETERARSVAYSGEELDGKRLSRLEAEGEPRLDSEGRPVLEIHIGERLINVGLSRDNILRTPASQEVAQQILVTRLRNELRRHAASKTAETDVASDWNLLRQAVRQGPTEIGARHEMGFIIWRIYSATL